MAIGTPYTVVAGSQVVSTATTAYQLTVTATTVAGDAIAVSFLNTDTAATSVTDSQGNAYALITSAAPSGLHSYVYVALGTTPLVSGTDWIKATFGSTGTTSTELAMIARGCSGIASAAAVDAAATLTANAASGTAISTGTSGALAQAAEWVTFTMTDGSGGGAPSAITGGFSQVAQQRVAGNPWLTVAEQVTAATTALTGGATITSAKWGAIMVGLSSASVVSGAAATVGAYVDPASYGGSSESSAIASWLSVISPSRTLDCLRWYFPPGKIPGSLAASGLSGHAGVRRVLMSLKPAYNPVSSADLAAIDAFLASCVAGGLDAKVTMYHEPAAEGLSAAQYKAMVQYYGPTVRKYYPLIYSQSAYKTHVNPATPGNYYPGDAWVDECNYDFYETDYRLYGVRLDSMASIADAASPPKPFSLWEFGVQVNTAGGVTAATHAQGTAYMSYVQSYMAARLAAGKTNGDIAYFSYVNTGQGWDFTIQPGAYLAPLYDSLYDALSAGAAHPQQSMASQIDVGLQMITSLSGGVSTVTPGGSPAPALAGFPRVYVEAAFYSASPVAPPRAFILDDPVRGVLSATGQLADAPSWTDITQWVTSVVSDRPATRVQGPLLTYQGGTATVTLNNGDGRFDPDNTAGPYASGGVSNVRPMVPVRMRAVFGSAAYQVFSMFADNWADDGVNYAGHYAQVTVSATDGTKVLGGITIPALDVPAGDGELSGDRVKRILDAAGWYTDHRTIAAGNSAVQGTSLGDTALSLLQLTSDSEVGELYVDGAGNLVFRSRHAILTDTRSASPQGVFGDQPGTVEASGTEEAFTQAQRALDDTQLANDVQVTIAGGTLQEATDDASVRTFLFPRTWTQDGILLESDADALGYAQWVLYVSSDAPPRFDKLVLSPRRDPQNLFPQVLGREIGDRIQVWRRPPGVASPVTRDCFIRGIHHEINIGSGEWTTTWTLQDASRYANFLILDSATAGKLGTGVLAF